MSAAGYEEGGAGAGGKFRKRPFPRAQTTPYDRPATALRPSQAAAEKNGWLSKLMDPASKLLTYGAHKLFSSVFRKRLLPPPHPPKDDLDGNAMTRDVQPHGATAVSPTPDVVHSDTKEPATTGENDASKIADASGVAELEAMLKQKTFTRQSCAEMLDVKLHHLTTLLLSRTVDNSVGAERVRSESKTSDLQAFDGRHESLSIRPVQENGIDRAVTGAISTPAIRSKVHEEDVASPAQLAKAYMGSRSAKVSPTGRGLQSQRPREESPSLYKPPFNLKSPATSLLQKPMNDIGSSENGFVTPRFRGRSAIYSMARSPYSRMHPTDAFKASETASETHGRSPLSIIENKQFNESQKQALKRRSSVLENDIGSVGPIRRIRQKPNLLHPKTLTLPASGGPRAAHGSGPILDVTALPPSSNWSSHSHSLSKSMPDDNKPSTSSGYVPSQSIETAQKIFQQLDKFSPKGKSSGLKIDIAGGNSPSRMTPALSGGLAHSAETIDSLKILQRIQDNKKENSRMDSVDAHFPLLAAPTTVEEASVKKFVLTTDNLACQDRAEARVPASFSSHDTKITVVSHSGFDPPQKKRAFQMSAHEDYLELDDDVHLNGVASTPLGEWAGSAELLKKSVAIPDGVPPKEAIAVEKPVVPERKSEDSLLGKWEPESLVDGPVTTNKSVGFTFPVAPSTSLSNSTGTAPITVSKSAANSEKVAPQDLKKFVAPAFSAKSDKLSQFAFSTSSSAVESAAQDTRPELPNSVDITAAKSDGPVGTERPSTQELVGGFKKPEGGPSPVISSAKGIFSFGSTANNATPTNALSSPIPTSVASSPDLFSSVSGNQSAVAVNPLSSPTLFSGRSGLSNGFAASTSATGTATAGTMVGTTTASSMPTFSASTSQVSSSAAVTSVSSGPSFQFGSSPSAIFSTSPSLSAENSAPKLVETSSSNTSSGIFGAGPPEVAIGGTVVSGFDASNFKAANGEAQPAAAAALITESVFGFQVTSAASPVSTSAPSFLSQSSSSASAPAFGLSGATNFSSGASVFGSVSPAASPFNSMSSSSGVSSMSSSVNSGSGTTSSIFSSSWQPSKSTFPTSTFGAASTSTGFSFGAAANGSSSDGNKPSVLFGSSTSNSSSSNSAPFVFGSTTPTSSSSSSASSTPFVFGTTTSSSSGSSSASSSPFVFGSSSSSSAAPIFSFSSSISTTTSSAPSASPPPSQPVFGNIASTPTFGFGSTSTPLGNNDQMSMEDSMAEDSMQAPTATPAPLFGQSPIAGTRSGGFVFGAAPSPSPAPAPGFMGAPSGNPFQFGSQPNQIAPQNPSVFQPSGSVEFHAGSTGSFSLGSGGGDKANRRIVKARSKMRRN
ncbi:hypothetical protein Cgig2_011143 [Carnegiea gigantea]|uniref:Nuclear pore complex protein n=1 Tax=Carnegiea gigantea TaxID=171969 RepID=A0A9Q1GP16_9CARY|nr:hypothetical protein Cgig2_011143 [Carnegiea gigantea]